MMKDPNRPSLIVAAYQPDIPQNVGAMIRLCACLNVGLDIIEPCGFPWNDRKIRQSAMDYFDQADIHKHISPQAFLDQYQDKRRIVLMSTQSDCSYVDFSFRPDDILLAGRESAGVPQEIHDCADARICIPMHGKMRSLNIVNATSMILGEALRQTQWDRNG